MNDTTRPHGESSPTTPNDKASSQVVASRDGAKPVRTATEKPAESLETAKNGTKSALTDPAAAKGGEVAKPATDRTATKQPDGTLSVYFLGGVGEFFVNGKRFAQQPPFDGVSIPSGTYRMACRMSGDAAPKEFAVTIRPNQGTVIEYEVGHDPVVTTE